jgi:hypothetical protein
MHRRRIPLLALIALTACGDKVVSTAVVQGPPVRPVPPVSLEAAVATLPVLRITTTSGAPVTSKYAYVPGSMTLTDSAGPVSLGAIEIRGRGNTTWLLFPKKPYRIKLATSASLLGMPANRNWVLLANHSDKTLLRNDLVFSLSRMAGMAWTPRSRFVSVEINGQYEGLYQLVEHVRIGADRVNITSMKVSDTSATAITGGYLLEVDERRGETFCFNSTMTRMVFCANDPETLLDAGWEKQRAYITNYIARTDSAIFGARFADPTLGYAAFLDVDAAINYYLIQELVKNVDGNLRFSTFLYKPRGGKLTFGPVWDFDIAIGNVNYNGADRADGWYSRNAQWFTRLFEDPAFQTRVRERYAQLKQTGVLDSLQRMVYSRANYLSVVQVRNFERWPVLGTYLWPNRLVLDTYVEETIALNLWLGDRLRWVDDNIGR